MEGVGSGSGGGGGESGGTAGTGGGAHDGRGHRGCGDGRVGHSGGGRAYGGLGHEPRGSTGGIGAGSLCFIGITSCLMVLIAAVWFIPRGVKLCRGSRKKRSLRRVSCCPGEESSGDGTSRERGIKMDQTPSRLMEAEEVTSDEKLEDPVIPNFDDDKLVAPFQPIAGQRIGTCQLATQASNFIETVTGLKKITPVELVMWKSRKLDVVEEEVDDDRRDSDTECVQELLPMEEQPAKAPFVPISENCDQQETKRSSVSVENSEPTPCYDDLRLAFAKLFTGSEETVAKVRFSGTNWETIRDRRCWRSKMNPVVQQLRVLQRELPTAFLADDLGSGREVRTLETKGGLKNLRVPLLTLSFNVVDTITQEIPEVGSGVVPAVAQQAEIELEPALVNEETETTSDPAGFSPDELIETKVSAQQCQCSNDRKKKRFSCMKTLFRRKGCGETDCQNSKKKSVKQKLKSFICCL